MADLSDELKEFLKCKLCGGDAAFRGMSVALMDSAHWTICRECIDLIVETETCCDDDSQD